MGKFKTLITLGAIASLVSIALLFKNKNMKNYILIGLAALVIGFLAAWFIKKPETKFLPGEVKAEFRDTCITNSVIAEISTETNTTQSTTIKKGRLNKETSVPTIVEVTQKDSVYSTVFSKDWNTGLMKMNLKVTVKANSKATANFDMAYSLDSIVLKEMTTVNNVVVVSKDSVDKIPDTIIKYIPLETTPKKMTYLGIGGLVSKSPKTFDYSVGLSLSHGKTSVSLFKQPTTPFNSLTGYSIGINRQLIRMSAK